MSAFTNLFERALMWLVTRVSGWIVFAVGLLFYPGLGLALPVALRWPTVALVETNLLGAVLAGVVGMGWLSAQVEAARRRHLVEWTTDLRC
jgi:hypothetical protein